MFLHVYIYIFIYTSLLLLHEMPPPPNVRDGKILFAFLLYFGGLQRLILQLDKDGKSVLFVVKKKGCLLTC